MRVAAAVLVVAAAGMAGTAPFGHLRWLPTASNRHSPSVISVPKTPTTPAAPPPRSITRKGFNVGPISLWIGVGIGVCILLALLWCGWAARAPGVALPERPSAMTTVGQSVAARAQALAVLALLTLAPHAAGRRPMSLAALAVVGAAALAGLALLLLAPGSEPEQTRSRS